VASIDHGEPTKTTFRDTYPGTDEEKENFAGIHVDGISIHPDDEVELAVAEGHIQIPEGEIGRVVEGARTWIRQLWTDGAEDTE
jgi:hypothetical protein